MRYREMRLPCDTEVTVILGEEARRARFVNLSPSGARLEGLGPVPRGSLVTLLRLDASLIARVVWSGQRHCGLRFDHPLSRGEMDALRGVGGRLGGWPTRAMQGFRELT
jgi:hypothetical protein